jgi:hypothetical protein
VVQQIVGPLRRPGARQEGLLRAGNDRQLGKLLPHQRRLRRPRHSHRDVGLAPQQLGELVGRHQLDLQTRLRMDMLIACRPQDETNLVACRVAHDLFGVPTTIARVRSDEFQDGGPLLDKKGFAVDKVICPEQSVTGYIRKLIEYPAALQALGFAHGSEAGSASSNPLTVQIVDGLRRRAAVGCPPSRPLAAWS